MAALAAVALAETLLLWAVYGTSPLDQGRLGIHGFGIKPTSWSISLAFFLPLALLPLADSRGWRRLALVGVAWRRSSWPASSSAAGARASSAR